MNADDTILCWKPRFTLSKLDALLRVENADSDEEIIEFIYHRLNGRFIVPLEKVKRTHRSGFLIMAAACLMIETLECFHKGRKETPRYKGNETFVGFFKRYSDLFPGFSGDNVKFYKNIRCGILHQAETVGGYRILMSGRLLDIPKKSIHSLLFLSALKRALDRYVSTLRSNPSLMKNARKKVKFICDACRDA